MRIDEMLWDVVKISLGVAGTLLAQWILKKIENHKKSMLNKEEKELLEICATSIKSGSENNFIFEIHENKSQNITYCWISDSKGKKFSPLEDKRHWFDTLKEKEYIIVLNPDKQNDWKFKLTQKYFDISKK